MRPGGTTSGWRRPGSIIGSEGGVNSGGLLMGPLGRSLGGCLRVSNRIFSSTCMTHLPQLRQSANKYHGNGVAPIPRMSPTARLAREAAVAGWQYRAEVLIAGRQSAQRYPAANKGAVMPRIANGAAHHSGGASGPPGMVLKVTPARADWLCGMLPLQCCSHVAAVRAASSDRRNAGIRRIMCVRNGTTRLLPARQSGIRCSDGREGGRGATLVKRS